VSYTPNNTIIQDLKDAVLEAVYGQGADPNPLDTGIIAKPGQKPGNSTCTASKAAGRLWGVAKKSHLIVAKISNKQLISTGIGTIFGRIMANVIDNNRQGKCVLSMSWG
jgi:hypothetical protein